MDKKFPEDAAAHSKLRASQYQHVDGTFELTFGVTFLLMAICYYGIGRMGTSNTLLPFVPLVVFVGGIFLLDALVQRFKRRVTITRSGYIANLKPQPLKYSTRIAIWVGIPILTVILLALLFLNRTKFQMESQDTLPILMPAFMGLLLSGIWIIIGWKIALPRFYLITAVSLVVSALIFFNRVGGDTGMAVLFGAMGAALCISGGITLWQYLRNTRPPENAFSENQEES